MQTTTDIHWNKGEVSEKHNERDEELCKNESHIDIYNTHGQSYSETWYHSELKDKYNEIFSDAIDEYNAKQKRKDRMINIDSYMQSIKDDDRGKRQTKKINGKKVVDEDARHGKQLSYEFTVKVGNTYRQHDANGRTLYDADNHHIRSEELPRDLQKKILKRYCDTFQDENANFRVVNVNYHADEGFYNRKDVWEYSETHAHIEIIPVATGFKQGLSVQNSMNKAMKAMGFDTSDCYELWAKKEQARLEEITMQEYKSYCATHTQFAQAHGELTFYHPVRDKSRSGDMTKEQLAHEEEFDEAIHEAQYIKHKFRQGCDNINAYKEQLDTTLKAQIDAQKALNSKLQAELSEAQNARYTMLQKQRELDEQKQAYSDAESAYRNATRYNQQNASESLESWAKKQTYKAVVMQTQNNKRVPVRDENGKVKIRDANVYDDYQHAMQRRQSYQFTDVEQNAINKAHRYDEPQF